MFVRSWKTPIYHDVVYGKDCDNPIPYEVDTHEIYKFYIYDSYDKCIGIKYEHRVNGVIIDSVEQYI